MDPCCLNIRNDTERVGRLPNVTKIINVPDLVVLNALDAEAPLPLRVEAPLPLAPKAASSGLTILASSVLLLVALGIKSQSLEKTDKADDRSHVTVLGDAAHTENAARHESLETDTVETAMPEELLEKAEPCGSTMPCEAETAETDEVVESQQLSTIAVDESPQQQLNPVEPMETAESVELPPASEGLIDEPVESEFSSEEKGESSESESQLSNNLEIVEVSEPQLLRSVEMDEPQLPNPVHTADSLEMQLGSPDHTDGSVLSPVHRVECVESEPAERVESASSVDTESDETESSIDTIESLELQPLSLIEVELLNPSSATSNTEGDFVLVQAATNQTVDIVVTLDIQEDVL
jgi:hypothetical protein